MPYELSWYVPNRIIHARIEGDMGIDYLQQFVKDVQVYLEDGTAPVHILLDDAAAGPPPLRISDFRKAMTINKIDTKRLGWFIGVGKPNPMAKVILPLVMSLLKMEYKRVDTFEAAFAFLSDTDSSLQSIDL